MLGNRNFSIGSKDSGSKHERPSEDGDQAGGTKRAKTTGDEAEEEKKCSGCLGEFSRDSPPRKVTSSSGNEYFMHFGCYNEAKKRAAARKAAEKGGMGGGMGDGGMGN